MRRPFFIDTDTASDDAVALVIALRHPEIDVVGISVVAGNVPLDFGVQNALYTRELCGRLDVPVYVGADAPLRLPLGTAQHVHGHDGMGDYGLALSGREPNSGRCQSGCPRLGRSYSRSEIRLRSWIVNLHSAADLLICNNHFRKFCP